MEICICFILHTYVTYAFYSVMNKNIGFTSDKKIILGIDGKHNWNDIKINYYDNNIDIYSKNDVFQFLNLEDKVLECIRKNHAVIISFLTTEGFDFKVFEVNC